MSAPARRPIAPRNERILGSSLRRPPSSGAIARRRWLVGLCKRALPVLALGLLVLVAFWPEFMQPSDQTRLVYRRGAITTESGLVVSPRYRGDDDSRQPYTVTAATALQRDAERFDLALPVGDIALNGGAWLFVQAREGTYVKKSGQLDLAGEVTMYRDDGTMLVTDAATFDLREGVATSGHITRAEGPFGTLDAQGFAITERGQVAQFTGPVRLVLNAVTR